MAEAVAFIASIVAVIQISESVVRLCKKYIESAKDAPRDIYTILNDMSMLKAIFQNIKFLVDVDVGVSGLLQQLGSKDGPIESCQNSVFDLHKLLDENNSLAPVGSKRKTMAALARLAHPLKEHKIRKLLEEIARHKATITLALSSESASDVKRIKKNVEVVQGILSDAERQSILKWLVFIDPSPNHNQACELHEEHTGLWMIRSQEWKDWLAASIRVLWIHGIPGAGKTILSSFLINKVRQLCRDPSQKNQGWAYYYCYHGRNHDETKSLLRWTLNQLCRQANYIPRKIRDLYREGAEPSTTELMEAMEALAQTFDRILLVVDALDESQNRENILRTLKALVLEGSFRNIQLLATSRREIDIERVLNDISTGVSMSNDLVAEDIRRFVKAKLNSDPEFKRWPERLLQEVEEALTTGAKGMFRWAVCQINILKRLNHESAIRNALQKLPETLDETYERILMSIPTESKNLAFRTLSLLCAGPESTYFFSSNDLDSLLIRVVCGSGSTSCHTGVTIFDSEALQEACCCLITVSQRIGGHDREVKFAHYTVKEFLFSRRISQGPAACFQISSRSAKILSIKTTFYHLIQHYESQDQQNLILNGAPSQFYKMCQKEALNQLYVHNKLILKDPALLDLVLRLFNPAMPHFQKFSMEMGGIGGGSWGALGDHRSWVDSVHRLPSWKQLPDKSPLPTLVNMICTGYNKCAKALLERQQNFAPMLSTPIYVDEHFKGSLIEICAMFRASTLLDFLFKKGAADFGFGASLHFAIVGSCNVNRDTLMETLEKLLEAGADPNSSEYKATPL